MLQARKQNQNFIDMQESKIFGFSELDFKEIEMNNRLMFQSELIPYPDNSHLVNMFGGTPARKESFLAKYKKGKRPQGKHRSKLIGHVCFNVLNIDPLELEYKGKIYNEREALQFKNRNLI
ncbi:hypothetical protein HZP35_14140 [Elizabethkingia anophelis]|nr:hypothetical protein [Elizabethkingia anophelis]MCT4170283.1 hypothetical protein [Elizabethkingia anophelis]MCT4244817.1 hypothetical protein [Elizabethkingia anophelis]MCT4248433.1 hypothetical protein [Elizabethkingia anophelis]